MMLNTCGIKKNYCYYLQFFLKKYSGCGMETVTVQVTVTLTEKASHLSEYRVGPGDMMK